MNFWRGNDSFPQINSHHRFVPDWDARLIALMERSAATRPLLGSCGAPFDPATQPPPGGPMKMDFDRFAEDGIQLFKPSVIADWQCPARPLRDRFVSGHFLFTLRRFAL